jgi:hypothetical protein
MGIPNIAGVSWSLRIGLTFCGFCILRAARHALTSPPMCVFVSARFLTFAVLLEIARNLQVMKLPAAQPLALCPTVTRMLWRQATLAGMPEARRLVPCLLGLTATTFVSRNIIACNHDSGHGEYRQSYVSLYLLVMAPIFRHRCDTWHVSSHGRAPAAGSDSLSRRWRLIMAAQFGASFLFSLALARQDPEGTVAPQILIGTGARE